MTQSSILIFVMCFLFLFLGYLGVPVAFALIAAVLVVTAFTPVGLPSMMAELFNGIDIETLLAVPFFLLVGQLMTSANFTDRLNRLSQAMIGQRRGGTAQVVTLFSMLFAGISGSSAADVAVLTQTLAPEMKRESYNLGCTAALIAGASTIANLIPPSVMAVVYGAEANISINGLLLGGVVPGLLVGLGLMIYSFVIGPVEPKIRRRFSFDKFTQAAKQAAIPMMVPVIILGGILAGLFTQNEVAAIAVIFILVVAIPLLNRRHIRNLPSDLVLSSLLYSITMITIAAASAFGWMLAYLSGPALVSEWIMHATGSNPFMIMLLLVLFFIVVGDFVDAIPAIIIFMPVIIDLTKSAGIDPIHMAVVIIVTLSFSLITPPYGLALLIASKFVGVKFSTAVLASLPIYIIFLSVIAICIFFPGIVLWLPKLMVPQL